MAAGRAGVTGLTVWGTAAKVDEIAARYDRGRLSSAHTVREFDLDLPDDPIRVNFRHDPTLELGDLDRIERIVKVFGMVNCAPGFNQTPSVIDGCSDLLVQLSVKPEDTPVRRWVSRSCRSTSRSRSRSSRVSGDPERAAPIAWAGDSLRLDAACRTSCSFRRHFATHPRRRAVRRRTRSREPGPIAPS